MKNKAFEKFANFLLNKKEKNDELKKYNINLSPVLGDVNNDHLQENENKKLTSLTRGCLIDKLHFWVSKPGNHLARISYIENDVKIAISVCDRIEKGKHNNKDINLLKDILKKHNCI